MVTLHWHTEPLLLLGILGTAWLYLALIGPFRRAIAPTEPYPFRGAFFFLSGLALLYVTVGSPLDGLGETYLFSAHMVQHELLLYAIPPLLIRGLPTWLVDAALSHAFARKPVKVLTHPVVAGVLLTGLFVAWHIPAWYEAALRSKPIHILEHTTIFIPALFVWWKILSPSRIVPPLSHGAQIVYVGLLMIAQIPLFAFLTFASDVFYPTYAYAPRITPLSPLEDQVLGGIIMKVGNMLVTMVILGSVFAAWAKRAAEEERMGVAEPVRTVETPR